MMQVILEQVVTGVDEYPGLPLQSYLQGKQYQPKLPVYVLTDLGECQPHETLGFEWDPVYLILHPVQVVINPMRTIPTVLGGIVSGFGGLDQERYEGVNTWAQAGLG